MAFAARVARIGESATLKVSRRAKELRAQGVEVIDFGAGEPDFASPAVVVEAARQALADGFTKYTPAAGIPALRRAVAERYAARYGAPWSAEQVMVTVGAKAALFELSLALFDDGDEVVLPSPFWVSFPEQIRFAGAEPVLVPMDKADGFRLRAEPIVEAMTGATKAVIVNSPCNPTGGVMSRDDVERLVAAAAERGVVVISDETYETFLYDGREQTSAASLASRYPETVVVVSSFSKTYAMTGWRLGYLIGPSAVVKAVGRIQSHATSNATSFAMVGAVAALEKAAGDVESMMAEYRLRRDLLVELLAAIPGVSCVPPAGSFYAFPDVSSHYGGGLSGSVELAELLLEQANVAVVPGAPFGADDHIRLSFACSRRNLEVGVKRIADALAAR